MFNKIHYPAALPIVAVREQIIEAIEKHRVVVIAGETGSGKTTQLPKFCLEAGRGDRGLIGCTQPRRIAAISVADRVAEELGRSNARLVGSKVRFRDRTSPETRIKFMTDGILLAEMQRDRELAAYDTIIVDEAHERSLNIDFLLGVLKRLLARRRDLKVIITSATIDTAKFASHFDDAPVIEVSGRTYPVEVRYQTDDAKDDEEAGYIERAVAAVRDLCRGEPVGDILVFMPTERDIRETADSLEEAFKADPRAGRPAVLPLFGRLSAADQRRVFRKLATRKIVVATNVAETSITVPGIRYVVDTGLARIASYNSRARTTTMPIRPVSRASADQRQGRCGRVGPGVCIRLYSEENYLKRIEYTPPEVLRANLAEVILRMKALRLGDPDDFPFVDPPAPRSIRDGYALLAELGAIDDRRRLTKQGRLMARLPLDPRIARMLIEARGRNALREVMVIAAALSIQDPRVRPAEREKEADEAHQRFAHPGSDFLSFLTLWDEFHETLSTLKSQSKMRRFSKTHFLSYQRMREWRDIHEQLVEILREEKGFTVNAAPAGADAVHQAILSGNLRNLGLRKSKNVYQGGQGKELFVFPGSGQFNKAGQWIMAAELVETTKLYARTVATIKPEWIEPLAGPLIRSTYSAPHWEKRRGQVVALEKVTLFGLIIVANRKVNFGRIKPEEARQIFIEHALVGGELSGRYRFLDRNQKGLARLRDMEDRLRQRDIVVDDRTLAGFYDERLPTDVCDQAGLNRLLKKRRSDDFLVMTEADLLRRAPGVDLLEEFPAHLDLGDFRLSLTYTFAPGSDEDGVSVTLPVELLPQIEPAIFEWLVPGLLAEKVAFLLKGLPKALRKRLIPVPQTAASLTAELSYHRGSLYSALEATLARRFGLEVSRSQWPIAELPPHLAMRFVLVDGRGRTLKISRNFDELAAPAAKAPTSSALDSLRRRWERQGIIDWDFDDLPDRLPIRSSGGALSGYAYPYLAPDGDRAVALRLGTDPEEARELNRQGLAALFRLQFGKQIRQLAKDCALSRQQWPLYQGLGSHEEINAALVAFVLETVFETADGRLPARQEFAARIATIRQQGLFVRARAAREAAINVLAERRACLELIAKYEGMSAAPKRDRQRFEGYRDEVAAIVPADFLTRFDPSALDDARRYLRALCVRVERAHAAPAKDAAKAALVAPHAERIASITGDRLASGEQRRLLAEYRRMLEEYKVSLFAQEIRTAFPVSAKRLAEKWQELARLVT